MCSHTAVGLLVASGCGPVERPPDASPPTVALIDTTVDPSRLGSSLVEAVPIAAGTSDTAHGTNLAGILAQGGVQVVALEVFDGQAATFDDVLAAFAWCIAHRDQYQLRVINLSLGEGVARSACPSEPLAIAIEEAAQAGLLTVVSAGDQGYTEALAVPACAPSAVSVGTVEGDGVATFSNSAQFLTLLAPGTSVAAGGVVLSGTSQSAAAVSAMAAHLANAHPSDAPRALRDRLIAFGTPVQDSKSGFVTPALRPPYPKELNP